MLVSDRAKTRTQGWFHSIMTPPMRARTAESPALLEVIVKLSHVWLKSISKSPPQQGRHFPENATPICIKCLLCANHPVRQQECKEKVDSFKKCALMRYSDNHKEVRVMATGVPRDQRGGKRAAWWKNVMSKLYPKRWRAMSQAKKQRKSNSW